jgi:hypothetical protein
MISCFIVFHNEIDMKSRASSSEALIDVREVEIVSPLGRCLHASQVVGEFG